MEWVLFFFSLYHIYFLNAIKIFIQFSTLAPASALQMTYFMLYFIYKRGAVTTKWSPRLGVENYPSFVGAMMGSFLLLLFHQKNDERK